METLTRPDPSAAEQERRAALVRQVRTVFESVGRNGAPEHRAAQEAWIRGEVTLDELIDRIQR